MRTIARRYLPAGLLIAALGQPATAAASTGATPVDSPDRYAQHAPLSRGPLGFAHPLIRYTALRHAVDASARDAVRQPEAAARQQVLLLDIEMELGLLAHATARLDALPPAQAEDFVRVIADAASLRADIAGLEALRGHHWRAWLWFATIHPASRLRPRDWRGVQRDLLDWIAGRKRGDALAVLVSASFDHASPVWAELAARVLADDGYPQAVEFFRQRATEPPDSDTVEYLLDRDCGGCSAAFLAAVRSNAAMLRDAYREPGAGRIPGNAITPAPALSRADAGAPRWREHALPALARMPHRRSGPGKRGPVAIIVDGVPGTLLRRENDGKLHVDVFASQSLDPAGEVSAGGYWVRVSRDGGRHFAPALYTGLRVMQPYLLHRESRLPLLHGDTLRLDAQVWRDDVRALRFPPQDHPPRRRRDRIFLQMTLADLARDSDADGLSDLAERAMHLDAGNRDSDGDGLADGEDPMPGVARRDGGGESTLALQAALSLLLPDHIAAAAPSTWPAAPTVSTRAAPATTDSTLPRALAPGAAFIVGDVSVFASLHSRQRLIVITPETARQLERERGVFLPLRIQLLLDRDGTRGLLLWSYRWAWGSISLRREDGHWIADSDGQAIT